MSRQTQDQNYQRKIWIRHRSVMIRSRVTVVVSQSLKTLMIWQLTLVAQFKKKLLNYTNSGQLTSLFLFVVDLRENYLIRHISPVHNTKEKRENAALFLRLGLPSRLAITKTELIENAL